MALWRIEVGPVFPDPGPGDGSDAPFRIAYLVGTEEDAEARGIQLSAEREAHFGSSRGLPEYPCWHDDLGSFSVGAAVSPQLTPVQLTDADVIASPQLAGLGDLATQLRHPSTLEALEKAVRSSHEHTFALADHACRSAPEILRLVQSFGASAFDSDTIQDLKHHRQADEVYLVLKGELRILWKPRGTHALADEGSLTLRVASYGPWAFIPANHCLIVSSEPESSFLAVAFKSKESNIRNGGKVLGKSCEHFKNGECPDRVVCEELNVNRAAFFSEFEQLRGHSLQSMRRLITYVADPNLS